ncbi:hypothetical protein [Schumannella soli]|uniref:hypothetical protein n=1 Tax=Schumannella soli TaxID=2590779 RepID=UPI001130176E|nr:hypothetical protein [Schumannella soli]
MNRQHRPPVVTVAVVLLAGEALVALAGTIWVIVGLIAGGADSLASAWALLVLAVLATAALAGLAVATLRGRAWARTAVIVTQLLTILVGVSALWGAGSQPEIGWPLILVGVALFALMQVPAVRHHLRLRGDGTVRLEPGQQEADDAGPDGAGAGDAGASRRG